MPPTIPPPMTIDHLVLVAFDLLRDALSAIFGLSELKAWDARDALGYILDCTLKDLGRRYGGGFRWRWGGVDGSLDDEKDDDVCYGDDWSAVVVATAVMVWRSEGKLGWVDRVIYRNPVPGRKVKLEPENIRPPGKLFPGGGVTARWANDSLDLTLMTLPLNLSYLELTNAPFNFDLPFVLSWEVKRGRRVNSLEAHDSDKEKSRGGEKLMIEKVEVTNVVKISMSNVMKEEDEITDEVYELKQREKGKIILRTLGIEHNAYTQQLSSSRSQHKFEKSKFPKQLEIKFQCMCERADYEEQKTKRRDGTMIAKAILNKSVGRIQAEISYKFRKKLTITIPLKLGCVKQQYQLYLSMKDNPQLQQQDIAIWLALQMKFENLQVQQTTCRPSAVRPRDQDDPHDELILESDDEIPFKASVYKKLGRSITDFDESKS
ncbi:hypothetical protein Tco_0926870 [Tanacetum coccineum]|uniref:Uncharacterized protein n=1 Tax=Tanacetum coccineum TaxID=301880 RepID=A0ABQ5DDY2_9ASTR